MSEKYDCNIVANNGSDFIIADNVNNGKTPILIGGHNGASESATKFNIDDLCKDNHVFNFRLKKTLQKIKDLNNDDGFIPQALSHIQTFIEKEMPLCKPEMIDERTACIFDNEPFNYMVENKLCMCVEQATMSQYICQQSEIKSYLVNSYANIQNITNKPELHAYVMYEDKGNMFIYDPANPRSDNKPRILDTKMNKIIFEDFVEAINHNKDSDNNTLKNRVGFRCVDEKTNQNFVYQSNCGIAGQNITPSKLRAKRDATYLNESKANKIDNYKE